MKKKPRGTIPLWIIFLISSGCQTTSVQKIPTPVKTRTVAEYSTGNVIRYSATIEPKHEVNLAFNVGGYVDSFLQVRDADGVWRNVQSGDRVSRGTVLARLRKRDYEARVQQARAALTEAQASVQKADLDFERSSRLFESQSITKADFDAAKAQSEGAQSRVEAARAQLREAQIALQDSDLTAPINSTVVTRSLEKGDLASPGSPAFVLADTTSVKAIFGVPDMLISRFQIGLPLSVTLEAIPGVEFLGKITRISPAADPKSRLFETEITIPNPKNEIKSGMIATIVVKGAGSSGLLLAVPLTAIIQSKGKTDQYAVVVVRTENGKKVAREREVTLGETFGDMIAVLDGVRAGEEVITTGATLVTDGEEVSIIP